MSQVTQFEDQGAPNEEPRAARTATRTETSDGGGGRISIGLPSVSVLERLRKFIHDVRVEMVKTTWPTKSQVWSTSVVVVIAVIFFGFYLWGCDRVFGAFFNYLEKAVR